MFFQEQASWSVTIRKVMLFIIWLPSCKGFLSFRFLFSLFICFITSKIKLPDWSWYSSNIRRLAFLLLWRIQGNALFVYYLICVSVSLYVCNAWWWGISHIRVHPWVSIVVLVCPCSGTLRSSRAAAQRCGPTTSPSASPWACRGRAHTTDPAGGAAVAVTTAWAEGAPLTACAAEDTVEVCMWAPDVCLVKGHWRFC